MDNTRKQRASAAGGKVGSTRPPSSATLKPPAAVSAGSASAAGAGIAVPLRPPLEKALDAFNRELRAALDHNAAECAELRAEMKALRAELDALRQRYAAHTHTYARAQTGGGGHQWIELRFLQSYIDGKHPGYQQYGIWVRGQSTSDLPAEQPTSVPSA
jgi:hypothetical protein